MTKRIPDSALHTFMAYDILKETRTLYLGDTSESGMIDSESAAAVIKGLHVLQNLNTQPIRLILNTQGGCANNGLAIFDAIHDCHCYVTVEVIGSALSMGAVILQAADERLMHGNSIMMLHDGSTSLEGSARDIENWAEFSKQQRQLSYKILASRTNRTARYWEKKCASDYILTAKKALDEGLIDRISGYDEN